MWIGPNWFFDTLFGLVLMPGMATSMWSLANFGDGDKRRHVKIPVEGVSLNKAAATLAAGELEKLAAAIRPVNAKDRGIVWSSDNTDVATVSDDGVVTAVSLGTAKITVTTVDGKRTATCIVTVRPYNFAFEAEGATITATCTDDCLPSVREATVTLVAEDATYTGDAYDGACLDLTGWETAGLAVPTIEFAGRGDTSYDKSEVAPSDAGTYTASVTVGDATAMVDFAIGKADAVPATVAASEQEIYDGAEKSLVTVTGTAVGGEMQFAMGNEAEATEAYSTSIPTASNAGTYFVWHKIAGDKNHGDGAPAHVVATIAPRAVVVAADDKSAAYGNEIVPLTWEVSADTPLVDGDQAESLGIVASAEVTDVSPVGTYDIELSVPEGEGNANYDVTLDGGVYTITDAALTVTATGYSGVYDGEAHGITVTVEPEDAGAQVYFGTQDLEESNYEEIGSADPVLCADAGTVTVYYLVLAPNYQMVTGSEDVVIAKASSSVIEVPEARTLDYTGEEQELVGAGSAAGGSLQYSLDGETWFEAVPTAAESGSYTVHYRVVGDENHDDVMAAVVSSTILAQPIEPAVEETEVEESEEVVADEVVEAVEEAEVAEEVEEDEAVETAEETVADEVVEAVEEAVEEVAADDVAEAVEEVVADEVAEEAEVVDTIEELEEAVEEAEEVDETVTFDFDANGGAGTMDSMVAKKGDAIELAQNAFTRQGYAFAGWNLAADGSDEAYEDGQAVTMAEDGTLYAQWERLDYPAPRMENSRGGTFTSASAEITYTVYQSVPEYAQSLRTLVELEDALQFTVDEDGVVVTTTDGPAVEEADVTIDDQWLIVSVDDLAALHGETLRVSYTAKIRSDADLSPYANPAGNVFSVPYQAHAVFDDVDDDVKSSGVEYVKFR